MDAEKHASLCRAHTQLPQEQSDEEENAGLHSNQPSSMAPFRQRSPRRILSVFFIVLITCFLVRSLITSHAKFSPESALPAHLADSEWVLVETNTTKVPLEAHIMSKCPDAKDCLVDLIVPSMEKVHDKVDFKLSFIGSVDANSDAVACMHGPPECLGNMIILCAEKIYPDPKLHLGFANCLISDYRHIPQRDLVEGCAMEHGLDFKKVNDCISDEGEGVGLLRNSVMRSSDSKVTTSCTVRLNGQIRCVRDGGQWEDCEGGSSVQDLVRDIEKLYDEANA